MDAIHKARHQTIDQSFLDARSKWQEDAGYTKAKWIGFCEAMLARGYTVELYEARETCSKYITVFNVGLRFRVRFSNHRPHRDRVAANDCDFFVGVSSLGTTTTSQAIEATVKALGDSPFVKRRIG